jgi:O-antigen ligase
MWIALFTLTAGLPWEWTRLSTRGSAPGGEAIVAIFFIGLGAFLALQMTGRWPAVLSLLEREVLLLLLLSWTLLSFIWSADPTTTFRRAIALLVTTYIGVHLVARFTQFEILRMVASVLVTVVVINLIWILFFPQFSGPTSQSATGVSSVDFDNRLTGIFTNPNPLGRVMALSIFTMMAAFRLDRRRRPIYVLGVIGGIVVLILSQSKTALVLSLMTTALLVLYLVFRARKTLFGAVAVGMVTAGVASVLLVIVNLSFLTGTLDRDVTLTGRVPLWETLLPVVAERPVLGHGYNAYWNGWGSPAQDIWNQYTWLPPHGHNEFLDMTLTLGVVGLVLYSLLVIRTAIRATRHIRDIPHVFGLWPLTFVSFYLSATLTESGVYGRDISWCLLVACIVLVSDQKRDIAPQATAEAQALPQLTQ